MRGAGCARDAGRPGLMPEPEWIPLCKVDELTPGRARYVEISGRELAVFRLPNPDRFIVTNNSCPHAGGNLSAGTVEGNIVTCPWHDWSFDLDSTECTMTEKVCLKRYETKVEEGRVFIRFART